MSECVGRREANVTPDALWIRVSEAIEQAKDVSHVASFDPEQANTEPPGHGQSQSQSFC